jgi:5-methylcytosine-specific restriction endonuclease McrA
MDYFDYGEQDVILCEACHRPAVNVHHIQGRGEGKDVIENLMALCRKCHDKAHSVLSKSDMQYIHNNFLSGNRKTFIK